MYARVSRYFLLYIRDKSYEPSIFKFRLEIAKNKEVITKKRFTNLYEQKYKLYSALQEFLNKIKYFLTISKFLLILNAL